MKETLGEFKPMTLRQRWPSEAGDFSPWLKKNIEKLGDALGLDLEAVDTGSAVGDLALDLLAKNRINDRYVVIENQYDKTNHDHLGKLITYAAGYEASAVVWVTETARPEHRQAVDWLNRNSNDDVSYYLVLAKLFRIDKSRPVVNFEVLCRPTGIKPPEPRVSDKAKAYQKFFQPLVEECREKHEFVGARKALPQAGIGFSAKCRGFSYGVNFAQGGIPRIEVWIDRGNKDVNKSLFDKLYAQKEGIEAALKKAGLKERLDWQRKDEKLGCRICLTRPGGLDDETRRWMIDGLVSVKRVFAPLLKELVVDNQAEGEEE